MRQFGYGKPFPRRMRREGVKTLPVLGGGGAMRVVVLGEGEGGEGRGRASRRPVASSKLGRDRTMDHMYEMYELRAYTANVRGGSGRALARAARIPSAAQTPVPSAARA